MPSETRDVFFTDSESTLRGIRKEDSTRNSRLCVPARDGLLLWISCFLILDAIWLYGACVRATGNTALPFWGDASVPLVKGESWVSWADVAFAFIDLVVLIVAILAVRRGSAASLRLGMRSLMLSLILAGVEWMLLIILITTMCIRASVAFPAYVCVLVLLALPFACLCSMRICLFCLFRGYTLNQCPHHDDGSEHDDVDDDAHDSSHPLMWA